MTRSFQEKKLLMIKSDTHLFQSKPSAILEVTTHFVPYSLQHGDSRTLLRIAKHHEKIFRDKHLFEEHTFECTKEDVEFNLIQRV